MRDRAQTWAITALLLPLSAIAQGSCPWDASCIAWTIPTQYTDGSSLPASSIASYTIEASASAAGPWVVVATVPGSETTYQRRPVSGTNVYRVTVVLTSGISSAPSNSDDDITTEPPPNAPIVTVAGTGYRMDLGNVGQIKTSAIGIVPIGIACKADNANGLNVIDRTKLKLDPGKALPKQVLAKCG